MSAKESFVDTDYDDMDDIMEDIHEEQLIGGKYSGARSRLEMLQEERELQRMISDDFDY